ncbi:MAG: DsrE family protein [Pseudomonadota bacterium]
MKISSIVLPLILSAGMVGAAQAASCPSVAKAAMDVEFGAGTSDITRCLNTRDDIKVVINFSNNALHKSGVAQQLKNVENMADNYDNMYAMKINKSYRIAVVGHGAGGRFLLNDAAYNTAFSVTTGNPSRALVEALIARGVSVVMCQNTMRGSKWVTADLIAGVSEVPAGVTAVIDYDYAGYKLLTP